MLFFGGWRELNFQIKVTNLYITAYKEMRVEYNYNVLKVGRPKQILRLTGGIMGEKIAICCLL